MEDVAAYRKIANFAQALAILVLSLNVYYFCFGFFEARGWTNSHVTALLIRLATGGCSPSAATWPWPWPC